MMIGQLKIYHTAFIIAILSSLFMPDFAYSQDIGITNAYSSVMELNKGVGSIVNTTEIYKDGTKYYKIYYIDKKDQQRIYIVDSKSGELVVY